MRFQGMIIRRRAAEMEVAKDYLSQKETASPPCVPVRYIGEDD